MSSLKRHVPASFSLYRRYFQEAADQIAQQNLQLLKSLSLVTAGLLLFFFLLTPLILPHWTITPQHLFFLPASLALWVVSALYQRSTVSRRFVPLLCVVFQAVLFTFVLLIDLLADPNAPASFMPALCISLPVLFIMPFRLSYGVMCFFEGLYILAALFFKDPFLAQYDIFNSVVGIAFSVAVAVVTMGLRLRDYEIRMKYKQLSTLDTLSGILNKMAWTEAAKQYLWLCNPSTSCALVMLDVDNFKGLNDELGHFTGDQVLRGISLALTETFRATDLIGRFGGDEFVVLVKGPVHSAVLEEKFRGIQEKLSHIPAGDGTLAVTCSIGAVVALHQNLDFDSLFKMADAALYQAKGQGKRTFVIHTFPAP